VIAPDATVVGILTGHVLKDSDAVVSYHLKDVDGAPRAAANRPVTIPAELAALERTLADALHG
jgi:threonine synthase